MTVKDIAKEVINSLPSKATMDDVMHAYMSRQNSNMESRRSSKKKDPHEEAKKRLRKWVK